MNKFNIGDKVGFINHPKWKGFIFDCYLNKPQNLRIKDGEYIYSLEIDKPGRIPNIIILYDYKESDLINRCLTK